MGVPPFIDAESLLSLVSWRQAIDALQAAVAEIDVAAAPPRTVVPAAHGQLLLMPAESSRSVGIKVLSIAASNAELPRIHAIYTLLDATTLRPQAQIDGAALTVLRTPALSALAVDRLADTDARTLTVFGSGPQAGAHVRAIGAVRPIRGVRIVARNLERAGALAQELSRAGLDAGTGTVDDVPAADIVVCATTSRIPLFDGDQLAEHACVIAVGSHEPDARELDDRVFGRAARVVVEDRGTALREAGDIVMAIAAGALSADRLTDVSELISLPPVGGISVFKSVGMGWQDLAVAEAAHTTWLAARHL